ncbi:MAG TPA: uroporphyrinogen-III C-methyltransferase [Steroidobacteraceae bacterium]|nr:uroporphyrinogen-III C-methyltransferase [Steroidobacteraceae bacterium]
MADSSSQSRSSRFALTALGIIALLGLAYAIARVDILRARIATLEVHRDQQEVVNASLRARNDDLMSANLATQEKLKQLTAMEVQLTSLNAAMGELRGRTEQSQRNWTRVETLYLLRLAEDQLYLTHDVPTALAALQAAELRLNAARDAALDGVRLQLAADIKSLRNVPQVDRNMIYTELEAAERTAATLKVQGNVINGSKPVQKTDNSQAGIERAWRVLKQSLAKLFVVRRTSSSVAGLVTVEEQNLLRNHLQLLLLSLRQSVQLHDDNSYRSTLKETRRWLSTAFDNNDKQVMVLEQQLAALADMDIAPPLPDISGSRKLLERYVPGVASP